MPKPMSSEYDWILSLLTQRIAADLIIQEGAVTNLEDKETFVRGLRRCQLHTRLLQLALLLRVNSLEQQGRSTDLVKLLLQVQSASDDIAVIYIERSKPMLNVLANEENLETCLRMIIILLMLGDARLKKITIGLRIRNGYVSIKITGGRANNLQLLDKELIITIQDTLKYFNGNISIKNTNAKRVVYMRLNLSSQLHLI